ncbi:MAG: PaaI family thioesterase [Terracidiphilus sp.]
MQLHVDHLLKPLAHSSQNQCFGCGPANPTGLRLEFLVAEDGAVVSLPEIPISFEGHPGFLHGGVIATLLDEAMSKAVRALGYPSVTAKLEVDFRRPVPSGVRLRIEGCVVSSEGRKHWTEAVIADANQNILANGKGLFVEIAPRAI